MVLCARTIGFKCIFIEIKLRRTDQTEGRWKKCYVELGEYDMIWWYEKSQAKEFRETISIIE